MKSTLPALMTGFAALAAATIPVASELPFPTASAEVQTVSRERLFDGVVEAVNQTTVSAQTSGRVLEINYDVDDFVERDDVIALLRDTDQRAALEKAEAELRGAQAEFSRAAAEYKRISEVFEKNLVSKSAFDAARAERDSASARLSGARAAVTQAEEQLAYTVIRAPYSGIVTERHVELGETVQPGTPVMSGVSLEQLRVEAPVPQRLINAVRELGRARVFPDEPGREPIPAESLVFFPYADARTNTFDVRVDLPDGIEGLFPGMYVKVGFVVGERRRLVVPAESVAYRSEVTGVYVVEPDGSVVLRQIRKGRVTEEGMAEVLSGLDAGEVIALDPVEAAIYLKSQRETPAHD